MVHFNARQNSEMQCNCFFTCSRHNVTRCMRLSVGGCICFLQPPTYKSICSAKCAFEWLYILLLICFKKSFVYGFEVLFLQKHFSMSFHLTYTFFANFIASSPLLQYFIHFAKIGAHSIDEITSIFFNALNEKSSLFY